jgi:hypothetical protein
MPVVKKTDPKKSQLNITINIQGNISGSNIIIGNDNDVKS